jgi:hypothetical protein
MHHGAGYGRSGSLGAMNACTIAIVDTVFRVQSDRGLVCGAANNQVCGTCNTSSWQLVRTTLKGKSSSGMACVPICGGKNKERTVEAGCQVVGMRVSRELTQPHVA